MLKPAVFLDRDGVINKDKGYVYRVLDFDWIQDAKETIKFLNEKGYYVFVITNQSGIARGYYSETDVNNLHSYINNELNVINARVDEFFISPYHPDNLNEYTELSHLRKPNIGMLELAEKKWPIDKSNSFLVGDKETDIECAKNYGVRGYLYKGGSLLKFIKKIVKIR